MDIVTVNAVHTKKNTGLFRTTYLTILLTILSFGTCWLLYGMGLSVISVFWNLILGPVLLPIASWYYLKFFKKLEPIDLRKPMHGDLAQSYFECLLKKPGPRPIFYTYDALDMSFFWLERSSRNRSEQIVLIPRHWLEESKGLKRQDFESIWNQIQELSPRQRRVRTFQHALWISFVFPLEILALIAQKILDLIGFKDLPYMGFWMFRFLKAIQSFWFDLDFKGDPLAGDIQRLSTIVPRSWRSLCFGVWALMPQRYLHPFSKAMTQRDIVLS